MACTTRKGKTGTQRRVRSWLWTAALCGLAWAASGRGEEAAANATTLPSMVPHFEVSTRMYKAREFFNKARGGKDLREFYTKRRHSRDDEGATRKKDDIEKSIEYDMEDKDHRPTALLFRPEAFDAASEKERKNWGLYVHVITRGEIREFTELPDDFQAMLAKHKLVYLYPHFNDREKARDDLYAMASTLDLIESVRAEYPDLGKKRLIIGGSYDGARLAMILATNFSLFDGVVCFQDLAFPPFIASDASFKLEGTGSGFFNTIKLPTTDIPYLKPSDLRKVGDKMRLAVFNNAPSKGKRYIPPNTEGGEGSSAMELVVGLRKYANLKYKIRFFDGQMKEEQFFPEMEYWDEALTWAGGKDVKQRPSPAAKEMRVNNWPGLSN